MKFAAFSLLLPAVAARELEAWSYSYETPDTVDYSYQTEYSTSYSYPDGGASFSYSYSYQESYSYVVPGDTEWAYTNDCSAHSDCQPDHAGLPQYCTVGDGVTGACDHCSACCDDEGSNSIDGSCPTLCACPAPTSAPSVATTSSPSAAPVPATSAPSVATTSSPSAAPVPATTSSPSAAPVPATAAPSVATTGSPSWDPSEETVEVVFTGSFSLNGISAADLPTGDELVAFRSDIREGIAASLDHVSADDITITSLSRRLRVLEGELTVEFEVKVVVPVSREVAFAEAVETSLTEDVASGDLISQIQEAAADSNAELFASVTIDAESFVIEDQVSPETDDTDLVDGAASAVSAGVSALVGVAATVYLL